MSELLEALILGIVQGLTEFLPVSSSGHLEIAKVLLNDDSLADQSLLVTVILHFATACATMVVFRKEIASIISGIFKAQGKEERSYALFILVSMIPAAIVGVFFNDIIESLFDRNLVLVACMLLITAILLFFADRSHSANGKMTILKALIVGIAQAVAILPGISRSGATIASSIILGVDRERAARFSFLMVIPLIFGKMAKDILDGGLSESLPSTAYLIIGFSSAFFVGIAACLWMIGLVKKTKLKYFAYYCAIVAITILGINFWQ